MAMVINTNIASINAVRLLDTTAREQSTSMERLTSGLRINKAADDAAGLAVKIGMDTQIRGTDMAIRNANDTIGMLQTLDGASEEVVNMLQRMRELGVQSLNGTYNADNRQQMQAELDQLQSEIRRVAETTKFNGMNIMNNDSFSAIGVENVASMASSGWSTGSAGLSNSFKAQVGWEVSDNTNRVEVLMLNFESVSAIHGDIKLVSGGGYAAARTLTQAAISAIDNDLDAIKTMRSYWGAVQNRLEYTVSNLQNVNENIMDSRSRIEDADFAKESANLARTQVLQQAGMSMLSQSNQQSQQVIKLLQ